MPAGIRATRSSKLSTAATAWWGSLLSGVAPERAVLLVSLAARGLLTVALYGLAPPAVVQNAIFPTQIYARSSWSIRLTQFLKQGLDDNPPLAETQARPKTLLPA